ncbi:hypothetical protein NDU88_000794 [Pleurodeles waltl]|uniref:Uncharacterized protein n=1 Tax=Pleurodeles waltl TaxID=8319 RepID=A0AAV7WGI2_PLEWA|nr:hypothetical protein NDU88_000794 [Pleurodeles waltl]
MEAIGHRDLVTASPLARPDTRRAVCAACRDPLREEWCSRAHKIPVSKEAAAAGTVQELWDAYPETQPGPRPRQGALLLVPTLDLPCAKQESERGPMGPGDHQGHNCGQLWTGVPPSRNKRMISATIQSGSA